MRRAALVLLAGFVLALAPVDPATADDLAAHFAAMDPSLQHAQWHLHDPSRIVGDGQGGQIVAATGKAQEDGYACGLEIWQRSNPSAPWQPGTCLFTEKPAWIAQELPGNDGAFWAPDLLDADTLVYSVAIGFEEDGSCVGLARRVAGKWIDAGAPLTCVFNAGWSREISAIDPSFFVAGDGTPYLLTGGGAIHITALHPDALQPRSGNWFTPDAEGWKVLAHGPRADHEWVEAAYLHQRGDAYYLFVNWGACCRGVQSTYEIRVGRSASPLGPFADAAGRDLRDGGGTLVLASQWTQIGPGHAAIWTDAGGTDHLSFHYYDADRDGLPWLGEIELDWSSGWPTPR